MNTRNTSKLLIGLTLVLVSILFIGGVFYPRSFLMAFAGTSSAYMVLRVVIMGLLIGLLVTNPPRSRLFRTMLATWAIALAVLAGQLLLSYQLFLLDAVLFIEIAIIFGTEALEHSSAATTKKIPVRAIPARERIKVVTAA